MGNKDEPASSPADKAKAPSPLVSINVDNNHHNQTHVENHIDEGPKGFKWLLASILIPILAGSISTIYNYFHPSPGSVNQNWVINSSSPVPVEPQTPPPPSSPTPPPATPVRTEMVKKTPEELLSRYVNTSPIAAAGKVRIGLVMNRDIASDLRSQAINPAFAALGSSYHITPNAMKLDALMTDGLYDKMWMDDVGDLRGLPLHDYFDYLILVKVTESTLPATSESDLEAIQCDVTMNIFSASPALTLIEPLKVSATAPGRDRHDCFDPLTTKLSEMITHNLKPLLVTPR